MKKIYCESENATIDLSSCIMQNIKQSSNIPAIICLGTNRIINDSLGPLVGTLLKQKYNCLAFVYGTMTDPITAFNAKAAYSFVKKQHSDSSIILIDATIGRAEEHGIIKVAETERTFFLNRQIPVRADLCVTAVTGYNVCDFILQKTKTAFVGRMAEIIAYSFNNALFLKSLNQKLLI